MQSFMLLRLDAQFFTNLLGYDKDRNNYLSDFVGTFSVTNFINRKICHKNLSDSTIDIMLTSRPNCHRKNSTVDTGLSDFHKMIISCLKTTFIKIPLKKIIFRDYDTYYSISIKKRLREIFIKRKMCTKVFWKPLKLLSIYM